MDVPYCFDCAQDIDVPVHIHAPIEYQTRYLYILKLDGGQFYVGQTNDLELRLAEHRDGLTKSTANRGKPRLVWFERWVGNREELDDEEQILTRLAKEEPRAIRRMVAEWQRPLKLLELDA